MPSGRIVEEFVVPVQYSGPAFADLQRWFDQVDPLYGTATMQLADPSLVIDTSRTVVRLGYLELPQRGSKLRAMEAFAHFEMRPAVFPEAIGCGRYRPNDQRRFPSVSFGSQVGGNRGPLVPCVGVIGRRDARKRYLNLVPARTQFSPICLYLGVFLDQG